MKGIYILFSGGYDSSYATMEILHRIYEGKLEKDTQLNLISLDASFLGTKATREKEARERLVNYWKAKYYDIKINYFELHIDCNDYSLYSAQGGLGQPVFWISSLLSAINYKYYDSIDLIFSYICGDQALTFKREIIDICNATYAMHNTEWINNFYKEKIKLNICFPLSVDYKERIISNMIELDQFVFDNCTTCEGWEDYDFCGKCNPCRNLKACFNNILSDDTTSDRVRNIIKDKIEKIFVKHDDCAKEENIVAADDCKCDDTVSFDKEKRHE